ncbi:ATP-grasp domain-containing protein [Cellulomonas bogoriensis]|uniref:Biotin carboxylase n=1 Tax=Cellulomonas bogoriensis 69B4 = DSM 16987 TaxID=1386082 RepID=A0A0A0BVF1_9CELL|nr:ATP-grasp domain-containing protein [Cellulomonas bogoriensis]KGM11901.1 biotin carboxylase [Cellulomonas bogoriensis 69B4 = DSM 16987]
MSTRGTVVLVDAYAPALRLVRAFAAAGCDVVRLASSPDVPPFYRAGLIAEEFTAEVVHDGDLDATVGRVAALRPVAVLAGGEMGVELADSVSEALGLASNGTRRSAARRDKFQQAQAVRAWGLRATPQMLVDDADELAAWHRVVGGRLVVKPVRSAGNDGVQFCDTPEDSVAAHRRLAGTTDLFGAPNDRTLAQQYLLGTEYVVNTVSSDGRHRVTDVWRYVKISANGVSDRVAAAISVPPHDPAREVLVDYTLAVLDALDVRHGPAHSEVMLTAEGPCLVEVGVRLCGADTAYYAQLACGESQIEWTVDAYLDPERFRMRADEPVEPRGGAAMVFMTSPVAGRLRGYPLLGQVQALPSFHDAQLAVVPGGSLVVTVDDTTEPLLVGLSHPHQEVVERDVMTMLYLDGPGFYDLEPATADAQLAGALA